MKLSWIVSIVIAAHAVVAALLFQGCSTTPRQAPPAAPAPVAMPEPPVTPVPTPPAPAPSPREPLETQAPAVETTPYTVQPGDALSLICKRHGLNMAEVMALNGIKDPNKLRAGQKLTLPGKLKIVAPPPKPARKASAKPARVPTVAAGGVYEVKSGDSLSKIAAAHGIKTADLKKANNLTSDKIIVGQKLTIPGPAAAPAPALASPPAAAPAEAPSAAPAVAPATPSEGAVEPAPAPAAVGSEAVREHTVEEGQDLYTVGMMYNVDIKKLQALNGLTGTALQAGQVLKIPLAE